MVYKLERCKQLGINYHQFNEEVYKYTDYQGSDALIIGGKDVLAGMSAKGAWWYDVGVYSYKDRFKNVVLIQDGVNLLDGISTNFCSWRSKDSYFFSIGRKKVFIDGNSIRINEERRKHVNC